MQELPLTPSRSPLCRERSLISSIPNRTNSIPAGAHGICQFHPALNTPTQTRRRQRNASLPLHWQTAQPFDGIPTSTFDTYTRSIGLFSNPTRTSTLLASRPFDLSVSPQCAWSPKGRSSLCTSPVSKCRCQNYRQERRLLHVSQPRPTQPRTSIGAHSG